MPVDRDGPLMSTQNVCHEGSVHCRYLSNGLGTEIVYSPEQDSLTAQNKNARSCSRCAKAELIMNVVGYQILAPEYIFPVALSGFCAVPAGLTPVVFPWLSQILFSIPILETQSLWIRMGTSEIGEINDDKRYHKPTRVDVMGHD